MLYLPWSARSGRKQGLALRGDSVTALTWAITERPRGTIVTNAAMVWTLLCVSTDVDVREVEQIAGEGNENCGRLSRRGTRPRQSLEEEVADMAIGEPEIIEIIDIPGVKTMLELCDPRREFKSESEFFQFCRKAREATELFLSGYRIHPTTTTTPTTTTAAASAT